jgi:hypothetical protein
MKCAQINSHFVAYLSDEIPASEKDAIRAHLGECASCQRALQLLSDLEIRLTRHLHLQAEQVEPASQAWNTLQHRVSQEGRGGAFNAYHSLGNRFRFEGLAPRQLALALLVILVLLWATPPGQTLAARIGDWVGTWFQFDTPGTGSSMGIGGFEAFTPYAPHYLPEGFDSSASGGHTAPDLDQLSVTYSGGEQFVTLIQSAGPGAGDLPEGEYIYIGGITGVFVRVFATSSEQLQQKIPNIPIVTNFDYGTSSLLAWSSGDIKIELISNLPEIEMIKIAGSLEVVESGSRESSLD